MNIIKRMRVEQTGMQRVDRNLPTVSLTCEQTNPDELGSFATQFEFVMSLHVKTIFWANKAQYENAYEAAARNVLRTLYADALSKIDAAVHAIYMQDEQTALHHLSQLRKELVE